MIFCGGETNQSETLNIFLSIVVKVSCFEFETSTWIVCIPLDRKNFFALGLSTLKPSKRPISKFSGFWSNITLPSTNTLPTLSTVPFSA